MHGPEVFAFTIREVPKMVGATLEAAGWQKDTPDFFVLHQANQFMLNHLIKRIGVPPEKMVWALDGFGNTSGASIPLAINHALRRALADKVKKLVLAGFGAGLSWGGVAVEFGPMCVPDIIEVG
jgi:3-oxoacyl-[acyl-carrier-protein] synthase-3